MVLGTFSFVFAAVPSDIVDTDYEDAVTRLMSLDVLTGYPDGTFRPEAQITRAEFAAVAVRVKGMEAVAEASKGLPTGFTDVPAEHWASGYVGTAAKLGIVEGVGNNKFDPEAPVKYEEAITMIVRALGYEPAAKEKGGYPFGYLIVANDIGLLEGAKGVQGLPATRGFVAQITDNALEIPMMIQVGYGPGAKWVVSGTEDTKVKTLLDEMGFAHVEGLVESVNVSKNTITVDGKTLKVEDKNFDYNYAEGMQVKAWYKGNALVTYAVTKEALVGVAAGSKGKIEVAGDDYDVARGATLVLDGKKVEAEGFKAAYAKVALNADNEIVWAKGYTLPEALVVAEVEDDVAYDYNKYDVNLKGYTLLKDGRTITVEDIEEEDVLLYNRSAKFAIVYNESIVGEIERVYDDRSFRLDGKIYKIAENAMYLDGKVLGALNEDEDVLDDMMAEEEEVEVFFNTQGEVILVKGSLGIAPTTSYYGKVTHVFEKTVRGKDVLELDVLNEKGKIVEYDIKKDSKDEYLGVKETQIKVGDIIKVTIDEDENPVAIKILNNKVSVNDAFKLSASYVGGYKLQDSTVIFYENKAVKLADAENIKEIKGADVYFDADTLRVEVIVARQVEVVEEKETKTDLVVRVRKLRSGEAEITLMDGERYTTTAKYDVYKGLERKVAKLTLDKKTGAVLNAEELLYKDYIEVKLRTVGTITDKDGNVYELVSGAKVYDITGVAKTIRVLDLKEKDNVVVYYDEGATSRFVKFVVRVSEAAEEKPEEVTGVVTFIKGDKAVTSESVKKNTALALKVNFNNDSTANVSIPEENAKYQIVNNKTGAVVKSGDLNTDALVVLAGKSVELGQITVSLADAGDYTIIVTVKDANDKVYEAELALKVLNDDATVSKVEVKGVEATPDSDDSKYYKVELPYGTDLTKLVASDVVVTPNDANAKVGTATIELDLDDEDNPIKATVKVKVTSEDGENEIEYEIEVTVAAPSSDATLKSLIVGGIAQTVPDREPYEVHISLPAGTTKAPEVKAVPNHAGAKVVITPAEDVTATGGVKNVTTIKVTAEDGETEITYKVVFTVLP